MSLPQNTMNTNIGSSRWLDKHREIVPISQRYIVFGAEDLASARRRSS